MLVDKHPFGASGEFRNGLEELRKQGGRAALGLSRTELPVLQDEGWRIVVDDSYPTDRGQLMRVYIPSGIQHMTGEEALVYARSRHGSSDFDRGQRQQRALPHFLRAKRPGGIGMFNQVGEHLGHVEERGGLVFEDRRELVDQRVRQARREPAERLLLHQRFA